ncbi:SPS1 Serine-threonine protein kinase [Pyrenophora tritici-repentis]|nr:SPS1 Serine-threonine protein kinase [Pyrenophora tritici-repentis]KAI0625241.1 SPS1 Serine-threonine protein kinase [Pyrenophora tritici-repentis]
MTNLNATATIGTGKREKRTQTAGTFLWKPNAWTLKQTMTQKVLLMASRTNAKLLVVKKVLYVGGRAQPLEVTILALLPECNRVVKPIYYSHADPEPEHGTVIFQHYPMGDLKYWKLHLFDNKNRKPVPESFIWRFFLQISQALAFIQGRIGPDQDERGCIIHCDIKPMNILVVNNGTTYPSFKLHDFDCATVYEDGQTNRRSRYGTFKWQPPENTTQGINNTAADVWALGACIHFLATGKSPVTTEHSRAYAAAQYRANNNQHPFLAGQYNNVDSYYDAHAPRRIIPINLNKDDLAQRGLWLSMEEQRAQGIGPEYHEYSDELNDWMMQCLSFFSSERPTTQQLEQEMGIQAMEMLRKMGGKTALVDMEVKFGSGT